MCKFSVYMSIQVGIIWERIDVFRASDEIIKMTESDQVKQIIRRTMDKIIEEDTKSELTNKRQNNSFHQL